MRPFALAAALILAACSASTSTVLPSGSSANPGPTTPAAPAAPNPAASGACLDRAAFAEDAEVVATVMQGLVADLKVPNVVQAKADAATLAAGLRSLADFVSPVSPEAAQDFRNAATEVDGAVSQFPGGQSLVEKAQTDLASGLALTSSAVCPE